MTGHVFVSYVREDTVAVDRLACALTARGIEVWLDREKLPLGTRWRDAIRNAIRTGDLFIACFSSAFEKRARSFMHEELTLAIEELRQRPTNRDWFIPLVLDVAQPPDIRISAVETVRDLHWANLQTAWDTTVAAIAKAALGTEAPEMYDECLLGQWLATTNIEGCGETIEDVDLQQLYQGRLLGVMRSREFGLDYDFTLSRVADSVWNYSITPKRGAGPLDHGSGTMFFHSAYYALAEGVAYGSFDGAGNAVKVSIAMKKVEL
jgi:TIR domain